MTLVFQNLLGGIGIGCIYALIALGYSLIFRTIGLVNFAQGSLLMFGSYIGLTFYLGLLHAPQLPIVVAFTIGILACALLGIILERIFRPLAKRDLSSVLLGTIGVGIVLDNVINHYWGSEGFVVAPPIPNKVQVLAGVRFQPYLFVIIGVTIVLVVALQLFLIKTAWGRGLRASAQDREIAACFGIPVNRMNALAFGLGAALAAAAGLLIAPTFYVNPAFGSAFGIKGFVAAVIGGLGDLPGAVVGGLLFGIIETIVSAYIAPSYTSLIAYVVLTIMLVMRPEGILGARTIDKV